MSLAKIFLFLSFFISNAVQAQTKLSAVTSERGFFSAGVSIGKGNINFLNATGDFSGYDMTNYGGEMDFRIWGSGESQFGIFASYLLGDGSNKSTSYDGMKSEETIFGVKVFVNSKFYLSVGAGRSQETLSRTGSYPNLVLSNSVSRAAMGFEFPVSGSLYLGTELSYRNAPVKKSENSGLTENTFFEGGMFLLKFIWSPPATTLTYSNK